MSAQADRPSAVFLGNCQAEALAVLLEATEGFSEEFAVVWIPPVHELAADDLDDVRSAVRQARLLVHQEIRDDYRGLPVGSRQLRALTPHDCVMIPIPALYCDAAFPFQVHVRDPKGLPVAAPLTIYHDLRAVHASVIGMGAADASLLRPAPAALTEIAERAGVEIRRLEQRAGMQLSQRLLARHVLGSAFLTVNHPSNRALGMIGEAVMARLGLSGPVAGWPSEILGRLRTPLEPAVLTALDLPDAPSPAWEVDGARLDLEEVLAAHLRFFADHRELARAAARKHAVRLKAFAFAHA